MALDERKLKILDTIVKEYIQTAEPVGSRTLSKNAGINISAATIRNEMADLEEMGYLYQPHTSAGRVPSEKAYRLYVDQLMQIFELDQLLEDEIKSVYMNYMNELTKAIEQTAALLSRITNYTSLVLAPGARSLNCKYVKLMPLEEENILMVLITKEKIVKNFVITLSAPADEAQLEKVNNVLNICLKDSSLADLSDQLADKIDALSHEEGVMLQEVIPLFKKALLESDKEVVYAEGMDKIFNFPEFADIDKAKRLIEALNKQNVLANLLSDDTSSDMNIRIGEENQVEAFKDCSLITATYKINGRPIGTVGVVGPTRMNYDYVVSVLDFLREELNAHISRLLNE